MYCTEAKYAERFGQEELDQVLATDGGLTYGAAAADADAIVDSYLAAIPGRTFILPLTTPPARVVGIAADLTRYELWANRASEEIRNRRDQAIDFLKDLVAGKAMLLLVEPEILVTAPALSTRLGYRTNGRTFTDATLAPYVGQSCIDDLAGLRGGSCD